MTAITFSDAGWLLTNLYWQQALADNRISFIAGVLDTTDYLDIYWLADPWTGFFNLGFSTNPTIPVPNQGLGGAVRLLFGEHLEGIPINRSRESENSHTSWSYRGDTLIWLRTPVLRGTIERGTYQWGRAVA